MKSNLYGCSFPSPEESVPVGFFLLEAFHMLPNFSSWARELFTLLFYFSGV